MSLPAAPFTTTGLDDFLDATPVVLPLPPGPPSTWTTLFHLIGPMNLMASPDGPLHRTEIFDRALLTAILDRCGRPTRDEERLPLLLTSPVPDFDLLETLSGLATNHSSYGVRWRASLALGLLGSADHVPSLLRALADSDNDVRRGATEALSRVGETSTITHILRSSWDSDDSVNAARLDAVTRLGAWAEAGDLLEATEENDARDLGLLMVRLTTGEAGNAGETMESIYDDGLRVSFLRFLSANREIAAAHVELIAEIAENMSNDKGRTAAAEALGAAGEEALEAAIELCGNSDWGRRMIGVAALAYAGPDLAASSAAAIEERINDNDNDVARDAHLAAHAVLGRPLPTDLQWTTSYDFLSRLLALGDSALHRTLRGLEPATTSHLASLTNAQSNSSTPLTMLALLVACTCPDAAAPTLEAIARDRPRNVPMDLRRGAAAALLLTGRPPSMMGALYRILLCHQGGTSEPVGGSLGNLAQFAGELATLMTPLDGDWAVRIDAVRLLARLGSEAAPFKSLLEHVAVMDSDSDVQREARSALGTTWRASNVATALADVLAPFRRTPAEQRLAALQSLKSSSPDLAAQLARSLATSSDRKVARAASTMVGETLTGDDLRAEAQGALGRLSSSNWVTREAACDLLGAAKGISDDLLEEVVDGLRTRVSDDSDSDVQQAATAALRSLGFEA